MLRLLLLLLLLTAYFSPLKAQTELAHEGKNSPATIALRIRGRSIGNYTVDTFVKYLNGLNENPAVRYVRFTEDDSPTGFYANYVLDIYLRIQPSVLLPAISVDHQFQDARPPGNLMGWRPATVTCWIRVSEKWNNEKKSEFSFSAWSKRDENLPRYFLIELLHQLLEKRFGPGSF